MTPQRKTNTLGLIVFVLITIICAAIVVNAWVDHKITRLTGSIDRDRGVTDRQLSSLQNRTLVENATDQQIQIKTLQIPKGFPRILLTDEWMEAIADQIPSVEVDRLPKTNTTTTVANRDWGISFDIPFNTDWKTEQFEFLPYNGINGSMENGITIGRPILHCMQNCIIRRPIQLAVGPAKDAQALIIQLTPTDKNADPALKPQVTRIPGGTIIKYSSEGMCPDITYSIFSKTHYFQLESLCGDDQDEKDLDMIAKSIKLDP